MPDLRAPTLKDVAQQAGVHVGTASRALSDDQSHLVSEATRLRVHSAAGVLGYRANAVAQSLRKGTTGVLGVVVADLSNPFTVTLLRGIEFESRAGRHMPLIAETHDDPQILRSVVTRLLRNRVDGIVLSAAQVDDEDFVRELEGLVPVVLAVRGFLASTASGSGSEHVEVLQDDVAGARTAVEHLIGIGHRRIAQLSGTPSISSFVDRSEGFAAAIRARADVLDVSTGGHARESSVEEGRRLTENLLRQTAKRRPTAIFAHNDLMAVGALNALRAAGLRCPADVSVVGYNDAPLIDQIDPPLTTVRLPGFELGRHSARIAFGLLRGVRPHESRVMLAPQFIERRSTQPPTP
ncbi:LacI family transcriptional regulator [Microbacterium sp. LWH7-1.2]|uniref:LacI family DNA-binding transcriptional regulator n=1 Tax=Microbacterium sp. LWH7-1.2 TaxID=3135257 RepID=UPI003138B764